MVTLFFFVFFDPARATRTLLFVSCPFDHLPSHSPSTYLFQLDRIAFDSKYFCVNSIDVAFLERFDYILVICSSLSLSLLIQFRFINYKKPSIT
jgi:hypothetical protein